MNRNVAIVITILWILTYHLWYLLGSDQIFFAMVAMQFVILNYTLSVKSKGKEKIVWEIATCMAVMSFIDEILGDPKTFGINDIVVIAIFFIRFLHSYNSKAKG